MQKHAVLVGKAYLLQADKEKRDVNHWNHFQNYGFHIVVKKCIYVNWS